MPKHFTSNEREIIYQRLIEAGKEYWERYGIKRTNVQDLARAAGISKGTFYLFFKSKELFFMEVLQKSHDQIKQQLMQVLMSEQGSLKERFVSAVMKLFEEIKLNPWMVRLMSGNGEYAYLIRKLPREKVEQHIVGDDEDTKQLLEMLCITGDIDTKTVSAALRGLFFILLHRQEVGEEQVDDAFRLLIEGLSMRIFKSSGVMSSS
ncbi:TetR/AcrR family transcriptional regulator [Candidatus Contubernalis alkaliaceticus]|uniref:TetR/AcrR family transcriptional regulator n=1 Tax=Candidatus Contubernalis alkaliaceticus TaxID=338645 RepID=UPI001F4C2C69|nr:TetR/AcrR family transcriptional regulator [Candidatus Contubernalis alkalaceticus]UNC92008.1 TetR/AcrR family transcriptional regulator [Candidatus Contubernalis alkalaceticus]